MAHSGRVRNLHVAKLLKDEASTATIALRSPPKGRSTRLVAWNDYLARVHADDQSNQDES